jgi:hypothetical protein
MNNLFFEEQKCEIIVKCPRRSESGRYQIGTGKEDFGYFGRAKRMNRLRGSHSTVPDTGDVFFRQCGSEEDQRSVGTGR